ncbi:phage tail-collar fiber domain-containing protein [Lysobacter sp. CA199]|uniref:phage tail-collar fiber domain-containing protein n=1 Tax=Lysobacter sp. CA199 TaxID=3455608 RepID=UPI003F8D3057
MPSEFYTLATATGRAKIAAAIANQAPLQLTHMAVGDGQNGGYYNPSEAQTALKNETYRAPLNALNRDPNNTAWIVAELVIPDDVGGFYVREVGIYDASGDLLFVGKYPESFKPTLSSGSNKQLYVRAVCEVGNAANVTLQIDPSVVLATRTYVDTKVMAEIGRLDAKLSARVATTVQTALTGLQTIDGVAVVAGDRVLVRAQANATQNGLYVAAAGAWSRATDADAAIEVTPGLFVTIEEGTANGDSLWQLVTDGAITPATTPLTFEMAAGRTGVSPAAYTKVTVNARGQVTAGVNPTTLSGFGITDAIPIAGGVTAGQFSLAAAPTQGGHVATKSYVDGKIQGLDPKESVRVASTANLALNGLQTIDGVAVAAGNRVLAKDQTTASENGLYIVAASAWTRSNDADASEKVTSRLYTAVESGTLNGGTSWTLLTAGEIVLGTTALNFGFFGRAGDLIAGTGLVKNGNQIDAVGSAGRIVANADNLDLYQLHATAPGWWAKCRIDAWGRVIEYQALGAGDLPAHGHSVPDIGGLQSALDTKANQSHTHDGNDIGGRLGTVGKTTTDWNTAVENGWWMGVGSANAPGGGWYLGEVVQHNSGWITQTVWDFSGDFRVMWRRQKANNAWGAWERCRIHESEQDARYFKRSGGEITGDVTVYRAQAPSSGVVFLGNSGSRYIFWDGDSYELGGLGTIWSSGNFDPNSKANLSGAAFWGAITAPTIGGTSSDERLKTDIEDLRDCLATVRRLRPRRYKLIADGSEDFGWIAQEQREVWPQSVHEDDDGMLYVRYGKGEPVLAGAITELDDKLDAAITKLHARIEALEAGR